MQNLFWQSFIKRVRYHKHIITSSDLSHFTNLADKHQKEKLIKEIILLNPNDHMQNDKLELLVNVFIKSSNELEVFLDWIMNGLDTMLHGSSRARWFLPSIYKLGMIFSFF